MRIFMAVFLGSSSAMKEWESLSAEEMRKRQVAGQEAWGNWVKKNQASIVEHGSPLGKTLKVNSSGVLPTKNALTAYTVVRADSHETAAKLFLEHPHFTIFPGDSVEVMECLPIPKV
ncbi:MAG: hypothetical protein AB7K68_09465 [Bacteriovoracia bacterium]